MTKRGTTKRPSGWWKVVKETFREWSGDNAARLGAALSYYTVFSLAPVLLLVIAVAGLFLGKDAAEGQIRGQLTGLLGHDAASLIQTALAKTAEKKSGIIATVVSGATLILGATGVMIELRAALNTVWKVLPKPGQGVKELVKERALSLTLVLSFGFVLLVSLAVSTALAAVGGWMGRIFPGWLMLGQALNMALSILVIASLFALMFKFLPDAKIAWRDVWVGAFVTSLLFQLGKFGIGFYLGKATIGSTFGAAGSLAVLLVWVYYSSQILLLGAEFTRAYANTFGSRVVPDENAVEAPHAAAERLAAERETKVTGTPPAPRTV